MLLLEGKNKQFGTIVQREELLFQSIHVTANAAAEVSAPVTASGTPVGTDTAIAIVIRRHILAIVLATGSFEVLVSPRTFAPPICMN